ncbi:uncharacterized protein BP5553_00668 [Venustampulla echinocandica]|uniref:Uncharacterized protein n=1 Tax=Venustampulla echinocandica TaxID=2656787 RepID=A0A370TYU0_9HELO|nr:uncharacterized protein BP5553_00668 [Venustampulla echinocandica]RDL40689.1 hypothetical protein BP5553_00668 [Venustampulla echinocandica]
MSGIPVYTRVDTASKASGVTPQTAAPGSYKDSSGGPNPVAASTTTLSSSSSSSSTSTSTYPSARPGAAAVPAPTGGLPPPQWPSNFHGDTEGPPAPQPGAVPTPFSSQHVPPPPPPKAGEVYHPPHQMAGPPATQSMPQPYPPQMSFAPPGSAFGGQPPASSMSTSNTASSAYPISLPTDGGGYPQRSAEQASGYQQNVYASELTNDQRPGNEANNASSSGKGDGMESDSMWNSLGRMAQQAGAKIAAAEADVWRKINKE